MLNPFDSIATATTSGPKHPYIPAGTFPLVQIAKAAYVLTSEGNQIVVVEVDILKSLEPSVAPGTRMSWVINLTKHGRPAAGNIKDFLLGITPLKPNNITEDNVKALLSPVLDEQGNPVVPERYPLTGHVVSCQGYEIIVKNSNPPRPFTRYNWSMVPEDAQAEAVKIRKELGLPSEIVI